MAIYDSDIPVVCSKHEDDDDDVYIYRYFLCCVIVTAHTQFILSILIIVTFFLSFFLSIYSFVLPELCDVCCPTDLHPTPF